MEQQPPQLDLEQLLADGNCIQIKPTGYSMYPLFVPGRDMARIAPLGDADSGNNPSRMKGKHPRRGDVVLYRRKSSRLVLHRIWRARPDGYYMVGDNQTEIEGPLQREQIRGILIGVEHKGKYFSVRNPLYRCLAWLWLVLRPVRTPISRAAYVVKHIFHRKK